jgi:replication fork clamp-binding protein CrfC
LEKLDGWWYGYAGRSNNNNNRSIVMDIKSMLVELAESQADKMRDQVAEYLASEEMAKEIATKINDKIDIPFVSEAKEQIFFEKVVDVVTDLLAGLFKGK